MIRLESEPSACSTTIAVTCSALLSLGVVMVFSATASLTSPSPLSEPINNPSIRQAMFSCVALVTMLLVGLYPYEIWRLRKNTFWQPAILLALLSLGMIALVLVPGIGQERNGARRWLSLGSSAMGLGFQPSEIAKFALVVFLSSFCSFLGDDLRKFWKGYVPSILILGLFAGLVGIEDLGTGALLAAVGACILLTAGAKIWHLLLTSLPGLVGVVYLVAMKPYRLVRLTSFLNPDADPQGAGYHQIQSLLTIASGGWWGRGLGLGIQKYGYLPESRTDFIFAVICEELGLIGGVAVIALFGIILWQGKKAMDRAPSDLGRLIALGATLTIGLQAAMNIAVVTVSMPTKGISLPLVSAGGTGVIFFSVLVGLLINVARRHRVSPVNAEDAAPMIAEPRGEIARRIQSDHPLEHPRAVPAV